MPSIYVFWNRVIQVNAQQKNFLLILRLHRPLLYSPRVRARMELCVLKQKIGHIGRKTYYMPVELKMGIGLQHYQLAL